MRNKGQGQIILALIIIVAALSFSYMLINSFEPIKNFVNKLKVIFGGEAELECTPIIKYVEVDQKTTFNNYKTRVRNYEYYLGQDYEIYLSNSGEQVWNSEMEKVARNLRRDSVEETVDATLEWIRNEITYIDSDIVSQKTAIDVFKEKKGVCIEFSNLASSMLRINGIYAKTVRVTLNENHRIIEVLYPTKETVTWVAFEPQSGKIAADGQVQKMTEGKQYDKLVLCRQDCWTCSEYGCVDYEITKVKDNEEEIRIGIKT